MMSYANWYVQAVTCLDAARAENFLLKAFNEPEYESASGWALVRLARNQNTERRWAPKGPDYRIVWKACSGQRASGFNEDQRQRYAVVIKNRILTLLDERSKDDQPDKYNDRLKGLATMLATLDGRNSADLVMNILALPGEWDGWTRIALAALNTPESKRILLSFVDPEIEQIGFEAPFEFYHWDLLASHIADMARSEPAIKERVLRICDVQLPLKRRLLLSKVIARLGTRDALLAGVNLIRDGANPPVPYDLVEAIETAFLKRQRYGNTGSTYTLVPQESNEIRTHLFEMVLNDEARSSFRTFGENRGLAPGVRETEH
jgi:hypothetical protein